MYNTPEDLAFALLKLGTIVGLLLHLPAAAIGTCLTLTQKYLGE